MLVAGTCIYVACKIEECPHHIRNVANEMRALGGAYYLGLLLYIGNAVRSHAKIRM